LPRQALSQLLSGDALSGAALLLVDRSISMSYGFGVTKLELCKEISYKISQKFKNFGVLLFDHIIDEALSIGTHPDVKELENAISQIPARGMTALSEALQRAVDLLSPITDPKRIVLLSDGRLNFSLDGTINECGSKLQDEALVEARRGAENKIKIDCIALGEDSFIWLLNQFSEITGGTTYLPDGNLMEEEPRMTFEVEVHGVPEEMPAGKPTWAKELDSEHLVVASKEAVSAYLEKRAALLINKSSRKMIRAPLFSIEDEVLKTFRERRSSTAESVRRGDAILVDSANRRSLDLKPGDVALLNIF